MLINIEIDSISSAEIHHVKSGEWVRDDTTFESGKCRKTACFFKGIDTESFSFCSNLTTCTTFRKNRLLEMLDPGQHVLLHYNLEY